MGISFLPGIASAHTHQADVERAIRTIQECVDTMLVAANAPKKLWPQALHQACVVENVLLSYEALKKWKSGEKRPLLPIEKWEGERLGSYLEILKDIHTFGAGCVGFIPYRRHGRVRKEDLHGFDAAYMHRRKGGHVVLRLSDFKLVSVEKVTVNEGFMPLKESAKLTVSVESITGGDLSDSDSDDGASSGGETTEERDELTPAQSKYPIGAKVMTTEGWAIVKNHFDNGDLGLNWPSQSKRVYSVQPTPETMWYLDESPLRFNKQGCLLNPEDDESQENHCAESATLPYQAEVYLTERADIRQLIGVLNADEINLPRHSSGVRWLTHEAPLPYP